jgi:hypothetical protein
MSADAGKGSGSKTDDVLSAILKRLKELGAQMRSMETRLESMESIKDKVSTLEASTSELGTQQDTLSAVIERVDLVHT